ncbi:MAG TPA: hypothetical protein VI318_10410 [Baekduia sp.]
MTRARLVAAASVLLGATALVGLGSGTVGALARAVAAGAAVGFGLAVLFGQRSSDDQDLGDVARGLGWGWYAAIAVTAAIGGIGYGVWKHGHDDAAATDRARANVSAYVLGQGFWAGRATPLDQAIRTFGDALRRGDPVLADPTPKTPRLDVPGAVRGGARNTGLVVVTGIVCNRYALPAGEPAKTLGLNYIYRLISEQGRDEVHVLASNGQGIRGRRIALAAYVIAAGPRRDSTARNTIMLLATAPPTLMGPSGFETRRLNARCADVPPLAEG